MALKDLQTQIITQAPDVVTGQIVGFIAASFRVWEWTTGPGTPMQINQIFMDLTKRDAIAIKDATLLFVCDGGVGNFLFSVDTSNPLAPAILDSVDLSAA